MRGPNLLQTRFTSPADFRPSLSTRLLLWVCLLLAPQIQAQQDLPELAPEPEQGALQLSLELENRLARIQSIQSELGVYDPALVEVFADLAAFYQELGDFESAIDYYQQALQAERINTGLNSPRQLPVIDKIIDSSIAMEEWSTADDMHHLRFYLKNLLYEAEAPEYVAAIDEMGRWKLRVLRENLLAMSSRNLTDIGDEISDMYRDGIYRVQAQQDYEATALIPLYRGKSQADLELARSLAMTPYQYFEGTVSRYVYQNVCRSVPDGAGGLVRSCQSVRRENPRYRESQRDSKRFQVNRKIREVQASVSSLNDILLENEDMSPQERAEIDMQLREMQVEFDRIARSARSQGYF